MTISSTNRIAGPFIGAGTTATFPFTFKVFAAADLEVVRVLVSTGAETTLTLTTDYTVSLNGNQNTNPGGSITLVAGNLATGYNLVITSNVANTQPTDLTNQGGFYPEVITDSLDRATIQIQQISDIGDRTLKIPISDGTGLDMELPTAAQRANSFLAFDSSGEPTVLTAGTSGAPATITRQVFSGTGSQTVFTLASDPGGLGNSAQIYIGGVYQQRSTYTIIGTTLTFSQAPVAGTDNIEFINFLTDNVGSVSADLVVYTPPTGPAVSAATKLTALSNATGITYTPTGTGAVARSAASKFGDTVSVKDFGAVGDGTADDTAAIQAAITYAASTINSASGMEVLLPTGTYLISSRITLPNRVGLRGANGRGTVIKPHSSFADSYMFHAVNGTSSMFGSYLSDMYIDARGKNMSAVVYSQAWQETCGMYKVVVQFDGTTNYGVYMANGYGGAALCHFDQCEIFSNSSFATAAGILVAQISVVGAFLLQVTNTTIAGSATNILPSGIRMVNDSLTVDTYHGEYVTNMVSMSGVGGLSANAVSGSYNAVTSVIKLESGFTGRVSLNNILPNGATNVVNDAATSRSLVASETGIVANFAYPQIAFSAVVSSQIPNVTGNSTEYIIVFNSETYDYLSNYNNATGVFTAPATGKYLLSTAVKITVGTAVTTYVAKISTSNREYVFYRGDTDNIRDGSGTFTCAGSFVVDMDAADTARVTITVSGLGSDTVDVEATETFFQAHYLMR